MQVGGNRKLLAESERAASALERARKLEREEGVASRGLPEPDQRRPRERRVEAGAQQLLNGAHGQAAHLDRSQPSFGHGAAKPGRQIAANGKQRRDPLIVEAGERISKRRERRGVQPLDVVDRETDGSVAGEQPQRPEESGGHRAVIGVHPRLPEQQRCLERPLLDRRQLRQDLAGGMAEEVGQTCEREPGLGLRRLRGQNPVSLGGRSVDTGQPQRRLADPGLARQHGDARKLLGVVEKPDDRSELFVPTDELAVRDGHVSPILRRSQRGVR